MFSAPEYEKVVLGMPSVCLYGCMAGRTCPSLASEPLGHTRCGYKITGLV
jgi:hypothetical protein